MRLGMIGLGKMGTDMTIRLLRGGHKVVGYDLHRENVDYIVEKGATGAYFLEELVQKLTLPRIIWLMIPAGNPVNETIQSLLSKLESNDVIVDGGNSYYKNTIRRATMIKEKDIHFMDVGTSGGVWGLTEGYCMMIGGEKEVVERLRPIFETLAPSPNKGWVHVGPNGAGHFVKMIHNGIEYALMEAYSEGFAVLKRKKRFNFDLHQIAEVWRHGSVIRSWLLDLIVKALSENIELHDIMPVVADSGEGRWTVIEAIDQNVSAPVITLSLLQRIRSRDLESFSDKLLAIMRQQFGGHSVKHKSNEIEKDLK